MAKTKEVISHIRQIHQLNEQLGKKALANEREHVELHFHLKEEDYKGVAVSSTKVMHSNAGFYIGHEYLEMPEALGVEFSYWAPYDRISNYYNSREAANIDLELYKKALGH